MDDIRKFDDGIERSKREREGAFFTPTIWVDEAHRMIEESLGEDWKEAYVVWDCAAGTGNLTRDYTFKELYCSTLNQEELDVAIHGNLNPEATWFQYDFLSTLIDDTLPEGLIEAFNTNKKIAFFINPPYGTAATAGGVSKAGISKTFVKADMKKCKLGKSSQNLYAQFLYKIMRLKEWYKLDNVKILLFSPALFLTGGSYKAFRESFFNNFKFDSGMMFSAGHFSGTKSAKHGILFSMWDCGVGHANDFEVTLKDTDAGVIKSIGTKTLYNLDTIAPASDWIREEIKGLKTYDAPQMTSAVGVKTQGKSMCGNLVPGALGYFVSMANNVQENCTGVTLFSSCCAAGHGLSILPENFHKVVALFTARKSIKQNWINDKDEYMEPRIPASDWIREEIKGLKTYDAPQMTSAIGVKTQGKTMRGNLVPGALGYIFSGGNSVYTNSTEVSLLSSCYTIGNGLSIIPENFHKVVALFTARRSIQRTWINQKDEYSPPDTGHPGYTQWNNDAIVYSLFNNSSEQSALHQIEYKNKLWDIDNEFFWLSKTQMMQLADSNNYDALYQSAKNCTKERYVYTILKDTVLSPDAKALLDMATSLLEKAIKTRKLVSLEHPEWHLDCWDAGYSQLKRVWKEYFKTEYKLFRDEYKAFEDRMREGVYKFGFLR